MAREAKRPTWSNKPAGHDFAEARTYLSLLMAPDTAAAVGDRLRTAEVITFKPKDLVRAVACLRCQTRTARWPRI
jgi:hypothetical protein